jgi:hypothetical protein
MKSKRLSTGRQLSKIMASELLEILDIGSLINDQSSCRPVESRLLFIQDLKEKSEMKHKTFSE